MSDDAGNGGAKTFTQADVDKIVRERIAREREKYADYDELKARAAEADKSKSAIERIEAKLDEATKRADRAEEANMRREVADELGLTPRQARRLQGNTREELLADGREYMEDNGIKPKSSGTKDDGKTDSDSDKDSDDGKADDEDRSQQQERNRPSTRQRPTETLRSGAPATTGKPEETDPLKLVANVRRF